MVHTEVPRVDTMLDRKWEIYKVKANLDESKGEPWPHLSPAEIARYAAEKRDDFEAHILRLPQPIMSDVSDVKAILEFQDSGKLLRVYPPFQLNESKSVSGEFQKTWIPEGEDDIKQSTRIPPSALRGLSSRYTLKKGIVFCHGLRVDCQRGMPEREIVGSLLAHITQYTHQWWLRAGTSPFNGWGRFGAEINQDFSLREELRYRGAGTIYSTWYGMCETQKLLGIEEPLTNNLWLLSSHHVSEGNRADAGFLSFYDALVAYMASDDPTCIFRLTNCVEILGSKRRLLLGLKVFKRERDLIQKTDLVDEPTRRILKKLFIDRDHIAHGREAYLVGRKGQPTIEDYVEAVRELRSNYLGKLKSGEWPSASQLSLNRKSKP